MQSVEWNAEATNLNHRYDWFVDLETCNRLRIFDVRLKRLQAESSDVEACARLISLWKVPCKSTESSEDCLQALQDSQQRLLSDLRMDSAVNAGLRAKDAEEAKNVALAKAKDAERLLAEAQRRATDAERSVAQKEEENNMMLERGNRDAEKRAAQAQEAARIARAQISAVALLDSFVHERF